MPIQLPSNPPCRIAPRRAKRFIGHDQSLADYRQSTHESSTLREEDGQHGCRTRLPSLAKIPAVQRARADRSGASLIRCGGLGWIVAPHTSSDACRPAIRAGLAACCGRIRFRHGQDNQTRMGHREPPWAAKICWSDASSASIFGHVFFVGGSRKSAPDQELYATGRASPARIDSPWRSWAPHDVTDSEARPSQGSTEPSASFVRSRRTQITDAGLAHLKGLTNLSELYL